MIGCTYPLAASSIGLGHEQRAAAGHLLRSPRATNRRGQSKWQFVECRCSPTGNGRAEPRKGDAQRTGGQIDGREYLQAEAPDASQARSA